jgi:hypothetical protein
MATTRRAMLPASIAAAALLAGCVTLPGSKADSSSASSSTTAAAAPAAPSVKPGMNARGEVIDPSKVESGSGRTVKGLGDWEGEIVGVPAPGSKFSQLQIGMGMKQATDIVGQPTDQGAYVTGKAFIPFFWGSDRYRHELLYKGVGRLIFAGGSPGNMSGGNLIWIIHSANETGYR